MSQRSAQVVAAAIIRQMTEPDSLDRTRRTRHVVAWLLLAMVVAGTWDLVTDSPGIWRSGHAVVELAFMREAARLTGRSERTVRQHAVSVYRKSGLGGRAELAAFFFEDMLLPSEQLTAGKAEEPARR
jgi:hypothetical protein